MIRLTLAITVLFVVGVVPGDGGNAVMATPELGYRVIRVLPHDPDAYTEGLLWHAGDLYESTGLVGDSSLREEDPADGRVLREARIPAPIFAEGIAVWNGRLYQLTWMSHEILVWGLRCLCRIGTHHLSGQGWGMTSAGDRLYVTDGTGVIRILDASTLRQVGSLRVTAPTGPVTSLNSLQWTPWGIFANIWLTNEVVRIDPRTGEVDGWLDVTRLGTVADRRDPNNVPNGIAWVPGTRDLYLAGKRWRQLYEVRLASQ
jgi:glutaminyl-peptide cyclotransferase